MLRALIYLESIIMQMENKNTVLLFQILRNSYPRVICYNTVFSGVNFFGINLKKTVKCLLKLVWICIWFFSSTLLIYIAGFMHTQAEFITMAVFHKFKAVVVII